MYRKIYSHANSIRVLMMMMIVVFSSDMVLRRVGVHISSISLFSSIFPTNQQQGAASICERVCTICSHTSAERQ